MNHDKIVAIVRKLESEHDGEVLTAARMLGKLARDQKKNIAEFLMSPMRPEPMQPEPSSWQQRWDSRRDAYERAYAATENARKAEAWEYAARAQKTYQNAYRGPEPKGLYNRLRWAAAYPEHLTTWEIGWLDSIINEQPYEMTSAQRDTADRILRKVRNKIAAADREPLI